jgi:hypothetical protein
VPIEIQMHMRDDQTSCHIHQPIFCSKKGVGKQLHLVIPVVIRPCDVEPGSMLSIRPTIGRYQDFKSLSMFIWTTINNVSIIKNHL